MTCRFLTASAIPGSDGGGCGLANLKPKSPDTHLITTNLFCIFLLFHKDTLISYSVGQSGSGVVSAGKYVRDSHL